MQKIIDNNLIQIIIKLVNHHNKISTKINLIPIQKLLNKQTKKLIHQNISNKTNTTIQI